MRAARLHGPGDLRVEEVEEPVAGAGEVLVRVEACTTCGTDAKMIRHGHRILPPYPCPLGHEIAGVQADTGERVLVSDSVACGECSCCRAGRPQICRAPRWVFGGFGEALVAPVEALHAVPPGLAPAGAAMAEPLAAAVHAMARAPAGTNAAAVLGGGPMGLMLARLLVLAGREVVVVDRHAERRAQAEALGAAAAADLPERPLVFEAVGRPEAWRAAVAGCAPGGTVVLVGGCPAGTDVAFPAGPLHYDEVDVRGAFHHSREEVDRALELLAAGDVDWRVFAGERIGLEGIESAVLGPADGPARKWIVDPQRR